jgi:S-adenosylmethionine decarboxylase
MNIAEKGADKLREEFDSGEFWGLLSSIDLHSCDQELVRDEEKIKEFVKQLCRKIEMKQFGETTVIDFGEDLRVSGFSMTQLIETSLISAHFVNQTNNIFLDIFSCKFYDPFKAAEFAKVFFKARDYKLNYIIRK